MEEGKMSLKTKLLLGGIGGSFGLMVIFIVVIIATLMVLGIIDVEGVSSGSGGIGYSDIAKSSGYWWPIGSAEPTEGDIYGGDPTTISISSSFGYRYHPITGEYKFHQGEDITASCSEVIIATKAGTAIEVVSDCTVGNTSCGSGWGNHVTIDHGGGVITNYAHMATGSPTVREGDTVKQGQKIGLVGTTGSSTGCHLHFEVKINGEYVDPMSYLDPNDPRPKPSYDFGDLEGGYGDAEENKSAMCQILLNAGYSENAVAAVLTNIKHEGRFLTNNIEDCYEIGACCTVRGGPYGYCVYGSIIGEYGTDEKYTAGIDNDSYPRGSFVSDHAGYGLIQWTSEGRKAGLYDLAKSEGKSIADIGIQTKHLFNELSDPYYSRTMDALTSKSRTAKDISLTFCDNFESPAGGCYDRGDEAENVFLPYVQNGCH